jgi:hypothetical protein
MKMCIFKGKKINGSPTILSIGNGWKKFKTTNELKVRDHLVFTLIDISTFKVKVIDNIKKINKSQMKLKPLPSECQ